MDCIEVKDYKGLVTNANIYGMKNAIRVSKFPMSVDPNDCDSLITDGVNNRGKCEAGTGHNNFLLGIVVQFDLAFTIKEWTEAERYHFFDIISSQSTMHRISRMNIKEACNEYVSSEIIEIVERLVCKYNKTKDKEDYLTLLYNVPVGLKLTAGITTNYLQLKTIYRQRHDHRLPAWRNFCEWLKTLPHSEWITGE